MIFDWFAQGPVFITAAAIAFAPGLLTLVPLGARGLPLLALAPIVSTTIAGVTALVCGVLDVPWTILSFAVAVLMFAVVAVALARMGGTLPRIIGAPAQDWLIVTALGIGILFSAWRLVAYMGDPGGISQTNDAVFHLNAVRYILETGSASPLDINGVIGAQSFYPSGWHAIVSLIVMGAGADIPVAVNVFTVVTGALIWPLGIAWLTQVATGSQRVASYAAVLSGALQLFPLLMFQWGVLYPNALSVAMIPATAAMVVMLPVWFEHDRPWRSRFLGALLVMVSVAALLLTQPAALLAWGLLVTIWLSATVLLHRSFNMSKKIIALTVMWVGLGGIWLVFSRSAGGSHWPPFRGKAEVILDVLFNGQLRIPFAFGISVLMLCGLALTVVRRELRWIAAAWAGFAMLYVLVAAVGAPLVRDDLLGAWYADPYRLAALAPIVVVPLAAIGLDSILRFATKESILVLDPIPSTSRSSWLGILIASALMLVLILVRPVAMPAFVEGTFDRESRYLMTTDSYLNLDERSLLESLGSLVARDARIIGNPSTGSGFGYVLSGRDVYPRTWSVPRTPEWDMLASSLRDVASDPQVCNALAAYGQPRYVLDFGPGESGAGRFPMSGLTDFEDQPGFELITRQGRASLWQITACDH